MITYYLSGPMTGLPDLNYPAFRDAATRLRDAGHIVYNPADWETYGSDNRLEVNIRRREFSLHQAFGDYCDFIIEMADAVIALPGWENSPGATAEVALAQAIRKPALRYLDGSVIPPLARIPSTEQIRTLDPDWMAAEADRLGPVP